MSANSAKVEENTDTRMGRPLIDIQPEIFEELCRIQCTEVEIAAVFRCNVSTIQRYCERTYQKTFAEIRKEFGEQGKASLRRVQFNWAVKNPTMALWLGKQYLGQADKLDVEHSTKSDLEKAQEILDFHRANSQDFTELQIFTLLIKPYFPQVTAEALQVKVESKGDEGTEPAP